MTAAVLIDTNVLSELARPAPEPRVVEWFRSLTSPATSSVVVFELARGIEALAAGKRRTFLERWVAELLGVVEVVPFDRVSAMCAAQIERSAKARGRSIDVRDLLILATAQATAAVLVTRNLSDFAGHGVTVYDPFSDIRTQ